MRYKIEKDSYSGHCCFSTSIIDTESTANDCGGDAWDVRKEAKEKLNGER